MADPETGPRLEATGLVLRMECTEPDDRLTIDLPGKVVHVGADGPGPTAARRCRRSSSRCTWTPCGRRGGRT